MGRELQKRKNRSSTNKVRQKPKSKKKLLAQPIIAKNWDKSQTLSQNYARLGLTVKLNKTTGGIERNASDVLREREGEVVHDDDLKIATTRKRKEQLDVSEAKIERDPQTGKILRVLEQKTSRNNPLNDPLNEFDSASEDEVLYLDNQHGNTKSAPHDVKGDGRGQTETVKSLEELASKPAVKYKRKQPEGERAFVAELVTKYGDDYEKMARDLEINFMQRSEGDIKRRVKKWRASGGELR